MSAHPPLLIASHLAKTYGEGPRAVRAIGDISLEVRRGEFFTIVGPSGAGKTTLLRCLAGLQQPTEGQVSFDGEPVDGVPRGLAVVLQDYSRSLFPWFTVARNVGLPLRAAGVPRAEVAGRVARALEQVGLSGAADQHPWQLSGGMQQRVAIARAIAYDPQVLVMDEPFASVDAQTRADLEDLVLTIRRETGMTVLFVTHDVDEAVYLSDRVAVLTRPPSVVSRVVEIDLPAERDQIGTKELPRFAALRTQVFTEIRDLVRATPGTGTGSTRTARTTTEEATR